MTVLFGLLLLPPGGSAQQTTPAPDHDGDVSSSTPTAATNPQTKNVVDWKHKSFFRRLIHAYGDDWRGTAESGPTPARRGTPAPVEQPPFPFADWPYGGSPVIGAPDTNVPPIMTALYAGPHGKAWEDSRVKIYGWANAGFNVSTSTNGKFGNAPAAYSVIPNSFQLDQLALYIERIPDTVQTDHFDWGFRLTNLYGLDYRYTTAKGILSNQLLGKNNTYGYDPVMAYVDLYFPKVAQGMNVRIGRYISLPDIEAQLAPNNYTFSHSLLYTYDCYTQTGVNTTTKLSQHWLFQAGLSGGCDTAPWTSDAKLTANTCLGYTWHEGADNLYACANSLNSGKYAYNNLSAYYLTYYRKLGPNWHMSNEGWYQYERQVPSIYGSIPTETNANGAYCKPNETRCFAPDWAVTNYFERKFSKHNYLSIRNEFFDDIKGQRTGYATRYSEHLIGWGHWIGSSVLFRPEMRFERSYDMAAYSTGTKKNQFMVASDVIFFF